MNSICKYIYQFAENGGSFERGIIHNIYPVGTCLKDKTVSKNYAINEILLAFRDQCYVGKSWVLDWRTQQSACHLSTCTHNRTGMQKRSQVPWQKANWLTSKVSRSTFFFLLCFCYFYYLHRHFLPFLPFQTVLVLPT